MLKLSFVGVVLLSLFMLGCGEKKASAPDAKPVEKHSVKSAKKTVEAPAEKSASLSSSYIVKEVVVAIDESKVDAERIESARTYDLTGRIEGDTKSALQGGGHFDSSQGDIVLKVTVTNFRLRSGASAFWLGVMAGADKIAIDVSVEKNGEVVNTFQTDISTALGGMALPAPSQRINRMSKGLSERIIASL